MKRESLFTVSMVPAARAGDIAAKAYLRLGGAPFAEHRAAELAYFICLAEAIRIGSAFNKPERFSNRAARLKRIEI